MKESTETLEKKLKELKEKLILQQEMMNQQQQWELIGKNQLIFKLEILEHELQKVILKYNESKMKLNKLKEKLLGKTTEANKLIQLSKEVSNNKHLMQ